MTPPDLPRTNAMVTDPDPDCCWAWPDGYLHREPPLPVAWLAVDFADALNAGQIPWPPYEPAEIPPCGHVFEWPALDALDGQRRCFTCCWPAGHAGRHGCIVDLAEGQAVTWDDPTDAELVGGGHA